MIKRWFSTVVAFLLVAGWVFAQSAAPGGGLSSAAVTAITGWTSNGSTITTTFGGIQIFSTSPNILRGSTGGYINLAEASGIESFAASSARWRHVGPTYFDGNEGNTARRGTITLAAGTGTAAVNASAVCTCTDQTAVAAVKCVVAATTLTATGTGTDVITYHCL